MKTITSIALIISFLTTFATAQNKPAPADPPILRVTSTLQGYNIAQPWEKSSPYRRRGLGIVVGKNQILTTAEMVADATFIQLQTTDGEKSMPAVAIAIDYEANLALLSAKSDADIIFIGDMKPIEIHDHAKLGDKATIYQLEDNGMPLVTTGILRGVDVNSSFVDGHYFLTLEFKASMQSASNSYTVPVLKEGKLLGLLTGYDSKDQLVDCVAPEIVNAFLKDALDGDYNGFPSLGVGITSTNDEHFRAWLKLSDDLGGIYINKVQRNSSAQKAGIEVGDVLLKVDGHDITRRGYYSTENYGQVYWSHLMSGSKSIGKTASLTLLRDGKEITKEVKLARLEEGIIPSHTYGKAPRYLIKGGIIFQELTVSYMKLFGEKWRSRAPIGLLDALNNPEDYEKNRKRLVFLSRTIPTDATLGYESIRTSIITKVNGKEIADIPALIEAFKTPGPNGIHTIELDGNLKKIYLDAKLSDTVDAAFLQQGLPSLSREKE